MNFSRKDMVSKLLPVTSSRVLSSGEAARPDVRPGGCALSPSMQLQHEHHHHPGFHYPLNLVSAGGPGMDPCRYGGSTVQCLGVLCFCLEKRWLSVDVIEADTLNTLEKVGSEFVSLSCNPRISMKQIGRRLRSDKRKSFTQHIINWRSLVLWNGAMKWWPLL